MGARTYFYPRAIANLFGGTTGTETYNIDYLSDTIKVATLDDTYTPDVTHEVFADLTGVITTTSALLAKTIVYTAATKLIEFKSAAPSFDDPISDVRWLAYYDDTHADKPLIGYADLGSRWTSLYSPLNLYAQTSQFQFVVDAYDPAGADTAWYWYGKALANALGGEASGETRYTNWKNDTLKIAVLDNGYTPNQDTHEVWADVSADEVSGSGYTPGGNVVSAGYSGAVKVHPTIKRTEFCASSGGGTVFWSVVTFTNARYAVLYNDTHADKPLLAFTDFRANLSPNTEEFKIHFGNGYQSVYLADRPLLQITVS